MLRILEIAWLWIAIITYAVAVFQFFNEGATAGLFMLFIAFIATLMYFFRKKTRIRFDKRAQEHQGAHYH